MMRRRYALMHWALTLLTAPFVSQAIEYIWGENPHQIVGLLEVYPITVLFSVFFSVPTFLIYTFCFYFLSKYHINWIVAKLILISITILGIFITILIIEGSISTDIVIAYSVAALVTGILLKIKAPDRKEHDEKHTDADASH